MRFLLGLFVLAVLSAVPSLSMPGMDSEDFPLSAVITPEGYHTPQLWPYTYYCRANNQTGETLMLAIGLYKKDSGGCFYFAEQRCTMNNYGEMGKGSQSLYYGVGTTLLEPIPKVQNQDGSWRYTGTYQVVHWVRSKLPVSPISWEQWEPAFGMEMNLDAATWRYLSVEELVAFYNMAQPTDPADPNGEDDVPPDPTDPDGNPTTGDESGGFFNDFWEAFVDVMKALFVPSQQVITDLQARLSDLWHWGPVVLVDSLVALKDEVSDAPPSLSCNVFLGSSTSTTLSIPLNPFGESYAPFRAILGGAVWLLFIVGLVWYFMPKQVV